jgi:two-component system chemotaxis response regulator CheB
MDGPIRVFLIDDSAVVRGALRRIIEAEPDLAVVGTAANGRMGLDAVVAAQPEVVLLDIEMPELDGLATLPQLLALLPGLKVIMASSLTQRGARVTLEALALGAADYITKPTARAGPDALAPLAAQLLEKIRGLAGRRRAATPGQPSAAAAPPRIAMRRAPTPAAGSPLVDPPSAGARRLGFEVAPELIAVASSTGGPNALATLLRALPREARTPIIITQHMPPLFTTLLAQRLERESGRRCIEAADRMPLAPGHVYIAPGDHHLLVDGGAGAWQLRLSQDPAENHCRPSADPMFRSVSEAFGARVLAVVLTGMGEDGRRGCEAVRRAGGRVLVQDEASSVVWGMPGAVVAVGCADAVLTVPEIAQRIAHLEMVLQ